jgi:hypothetical protein
MDPIDRCTTALLDEYQQRQQQDIADSPVIQLNTFNYLGKKFAPSLSAILVIIILKKNQALT